MRITLNRKDRLPVHTQLKAQLAYLIQSGQLSEGTQLPTVRQLAGFLRVNRNTVSKVFAELQREGHLSCEPGRGTFVSPANIKSKNRMERMQKLLAVVDDAIERAKGLGFSPEELSLTLYARTQASLPASKLPRKLAALFIECSRKQLEYFSSELSRQLSIPVDPLLVDELKTQAHADRDSFRRYDLVVTTFYHIREVQALLAGTGIETLALMVDASLETLMRLTSLPEGTTVGVACTDWTGSENMKLSIQRAGLNHLRVIMGCGEDQASLNNMIAKASVVVCSSLIENTIRACAPADKEILVDHRRLDQAGIEMLKTRLAEIAGSGSEGGAF